MSPSGQAPAAAARQADPGQAALIAQARRDDQAAWEELLRQHQQPVFRLAYLIMGDAAEAEEIAQEAFVRAYLSLDTFDETYPFRPWVMQITRNLARNRRRSLGRYWHHLRRWWRQQPEPVAPPPGGRADARLLWQAVRRLKPDWQEVIYLRYFLELPVAEAAVALEVAPGTVKSRLHRALAALRDLIEQDYVELMP